jgi:hypothetical protein
VLRVNFDERPRKLEPVMRQHDISAVALMRKHGWLAYYADDLIGSQSPPTEEAP